MEWTDRLTAVLPKGATESLQATAEDGHLLHADLIPQQTGMVIVVVTCWPLPIVDQADGKRIGDEARFPTLPELVEACDQLAPMCLFHTAWPSLAPEDRPQPPPGARAVPCEQIAELRPVSALELPQGAGRIIGAIHDA